MGWGSARVGDYLGQERERERERVETRERQRGRFSGFWGVQGESGGLCLDSAVACQGREGQGESGTGDSRYGDEKDKKILWCGKTSVALSPLWPPHILGHSHLISFEGYSLSIGSWKT